MAGFDFLDGLRVLEVAWLGPDSLGGYLADLGAEVIKIEGPDPDPVRTVGTPAVGASDGPGMLHLRWNRGKQSIGLDLKQERGRQIFRELADASQVVIEGTRAGMLDRLDLGYDSLRQANPRLVFCSLSGFGTSGPYHTLGSHAPAFDAFAGIAALNLYALGTDERKRSPYAPVGMNAMGLYAAVAVLAAVRRAEHTGVGAIIEVSGAEAAAHWIPDGVNVVLNRDCLVEREPRFTGSDGRMIGWPRLHGYETSDGRAVFLQAQNPRFWTRFCAAIGRPDLDRRSAGGTDVAADAALHATLSGIFRTRPFAEWMELFVKHDVPGSPINRLADLAVDPHFLARDNIYETEHRGKKLRLTSTPIKTHGQKFEPAAPPEAWADTEAVLGRVLNLGPEAIRGLCAERVVLTRSRDAG